jgi:hypothetical protein
MPLCRQLLGLILAAAPVDLRVTPEHLQIAKFLLNGGAANRIRTCDPVITNDVLYQLSYCGGPSGAFIISLNACRT